MRRERATMRGQRRRDWRVEPLESRQLMASNVISGFVYNDANHDGIFDNGEQPIANSSIELKDSTGAVVGTTTTDANGRYQFTVNQTTVTPAAKTQTQVVALPTLATPNTRTVSLPQFDPSLGTLTSVDVINQLNLSNHVQLENTSAGSATLTALTAGNQQLTGTGIAPLTALSNNTAVFDATAFDGIVDFGGTSGKDFGLRTTTNVQSETVTDPATVAAFIGTGTVSYTAAADGSVAITGSGNIAQATTTQSGGSVTLVYHYTPPSVVVPANYTIVQTVEPPGFTDGFESRGTVVIPNTIGTDFIPVTVLSSDVPNNNFGEFAVVPPTSSSLSGSVYLDTNNDGVREENEYGIAHVAITLTGTDIQGRKVSLSTTTADDGTYTFNGLAAGTYTLSEAATPAFREGKNRAGTLGGTVIKDQITTIVVPAGVAGIQNNFGELARSNCRINALIALNRLNGFTLLASEIGPLIRFNLPTLVPVLTRPALVHAAHRHAHV